MSDKPSSRRSFFNPRAIKRAMLDRPLEAPGGMRAQDSDATSNKADAEESQGILPAPSEDSFSRAEAYVFQVTRQAMACEFSVILNDGAGDSAGSFYADAAMELLDLVEQLESEMTVYRESSRVMEINRRGAVEPVFVGPRLFGLLEKAIELYQFTEGAFDITSGPLSKAWGFYRRQGEVPGPEALQKALDNVGSQWLRLDHAESEVRLLKQGVELNLGGIGKGFALDQCAERFSDSNIEDCLLHGGQSSMLARGHRAGIEKRGRRGWPIGLRHPVWQGKRLAEIFLHNRALGTSGTGRQGFVHNGRRYGHIIDPRTGIPADGVLSSTVLAPTAAEADALATAFYVLGPEKSQELCGQRADIAMLMVTPAERQGSINVHTANLEDNDWLRLDLIDE